ncbi:MAG: toprim domain-containing protein [Candidatus Thermoplasmatota archaeon]|nr:toprim domain-containing protein [Candidatus Thermoplasmatota archaeon]
MNECMPIIVEGKKDVAALRFLGCSGVIITVNKGVSLTEFCDRIAQLYDTVILLTDWDRKGGSLCKRMMRLLKGRVTYNTTYRDIFAKYAMTRKVEGLPSWIETMKHKTDHSEKNSETY